MKRAIPAAGAGFLKLGVLGSDGMGSSRKVWEIGWHDGRGRCDLVGLGECVQGETWQGWGKWSASPPAFESFSTAPPSSSAPQSTVQSYLEGVSVGLEQLRSAAQEVQSVCQDLGAAQWALLDSADRFQGLQQMRALMAEHVQLASVVQVLPQLFSGKALARSSWIWAGRRRGELQSCPGLRAGLAAKLEQVALALPVGFGKSPWMEVPLPPQGLIRHGVPRAPGLGPFPSASSC